MFAGIQKGIGLADKNELAACLLYRTVCVARVLKKRRKGRVVRICLI
jgi:hypothetical protein